MSALTSTIFDNNNINNNAVPKFIFLSSHYYIVINNAVCIIESYLCHDIKQAMSYHIMEFYIMTCRMS